jgi:hypothetical protein
MGTLTTGLLTGSVFFGIFRAVAKSHEMARNYFGNEFPLHKIIGEGEQENGRIHLGRNSCPGGLRNQEMGIVYHSRDREVGRFQAHGPDGTKSRDE